MRGCKSILFPEKTEIYAILLYKKSNENGVFLFEVGVKPFEEFPLPHDTVLRF